MDIILFKTRKGCKECHHDKQKWDDTKDGVKAQTRGKKGKFLIDKGTDKLFNISKNLFEFCFVELHLFTPCPLYGLKSVLQTS